MHRSLLVLPALAIIATGCWSTEGFVPTAFDVRDSIFVGSRPYGAAISSDGLAFITQLDAAAVVSVRPGLTSTSGAPIAVGTVPTSVAVSPAGDVALVTNQYEFTVGFINLGSRQQVGTVPARSNTFRVAFNATGSRAYVTQSEGPVLVLDVAARTRIDTIPTIAAPNGLAIVGDTLAIVTSTNGQIAYLDLRSRLEIKRFQTGATHQDVVVSADGTEFYVANEWGNDIEVRSLVTGAVIGTIPVGRGTFGLALTPDGRRLWATHPGDFFTEGGLSETDPAKRVLLRTFAMTDPRRIAFSPTRTFGVVSDQSGWVYFLR